MIWPRLLQGCLTEILSTPEGMEATEANHASIRTKANREKRNVMPAKATGPHPVIAGAPGTKDLIL